MMDKKINVRSLVKDLYELGGRQPLDRAVQASSAALLRHPEKSVVRLASYVGAVNLMNELGSTDSITLKGTGFVHTDGHVLSPVERGLFREESRNGRGTTYCLTGQAIADVYVQKVKELIGVLNGS